MVYVKNPKYYDADNVTMDEIHIMLSADDTATYAAYNSGDLDFVDTVPNDEISTLNGKNSDFHIIPNLGTYYVGFNVNDPIFDGKTVEQAASMRKAMNLLIDREFIVENVGQTGQIAADSFVPAGMSDGNGGVFKTDDTSYYDADKTGADQVEEAKKLLESAGYTFTDNGDGSYKCDPAISMTFLTNDDILQLGSPCSRISHCWGSIWRLSRKTGMYLLKTVSPATLPSPARDGWQITTTRSIC